MFSRALVLLVLALIVPSSAQAQAKEPTSANQSPSNPPPPSQAPANQTPTNQTPTGPNTQTRAPQAGADRPATLISATSSAATVTVQLRGLSADTKTIVERDFETGMLVVPQQPGLQVRPSVTLVGATPIAAGESLVTLTLSGLMAFGETSVSLLYKGRQVETLRFFKAGLLAKPSGDGGFIVQGQTPFFLVLENVSTFGYTAVQARLRFDNQDLCTFAVERPTVVGPAATTTEPAAPIDCLNPGNWTQFDLLQYAQVTLSAKPPDAWFVDSASGLARSAKKKGLLSLRFAGSTTEVYEQNVPIEIDFKPDEWTLLRSIVHVGKWIVVGALLSIFLRISLPNLKRRRQLKNELSEVAKATAAISTVTSSNLRVLLRVARLELREILKSGWWFGPNDSEFAERVKQALPGLKKRVDGVRRLDAALIRRAVLVEQGIAPTRLEEIDELADSLRESLKQDQLSDEDWVPLNQRLDGLRKLLQEPTQTEREAIEAMLAGRWRDIRDHFGAQADGSLVVPATLQGLEACFPSASLLPRPPDDGSKWVKAIGTVRADLQLTALQRLWDFQFLVPAMVAGQVPDPKWVKARQELSRLLATPATDNLLAAKLLLRQLASGISSDDIMTALAAGKARIVLDPQIPSTNQKIRYQVCFLQDELNTAVARESVACHWRFEDRPRTRRLRRLRALWQSAKETETRDDTVRFEEGGWSVYHYVEPDVSQSAVKVTFHDPEGEEIALGEASGWAQRTIQPTPNKRRGQWAAFGLEAVQLGATVLVPLATLAITTAGGATVGPSWELIGIGFGADTLKNIIAGSSTASTPGPPA